MRAILISMSFIFICISALAQLGQDEKLPQVWSRGYTISVSYASSMGGASTGIVFTFDSCKYTSKSLHKRSEVKGYLLKEYDRVGILDKLNRLKLDDIETKQSINVVSDGWSQSICFGHRCIEGGTSAEMKDEDKQNFLTAYRFLEAFALKKTK